MPVDLVIFDCDGVLIDSEVVAARVHARAFTAAGWSTDEQTVIDRFKGLTDAIMYRIVENELGRPLPPDHRDVVDAEILRTYRNELAAIPGIHDVVAALDTQFCVASNSPTNKVELGLKVTHLHDSFSPNIFTASMVAEGKPAPDLFLHAATSFGVPPSRCLVVEDTVTGVTAGRAANMTTIGFCGGSHCRPGDAELLAEHGAVRVIDHMNQLLPVLRDLDE